MGNLATSVQGMRRILGVVVGLLVAAALVIGGYAVGVASGRPRVADFTQLDQALALALGVSPTEVRADPQYHQFERDGCVSGTCRQVSISPVPSLGTVMQSRLYGAGWVLLNHDQPECVSDNPRVTGFVCSYARGDVTVSVQVESPEVPDSVSVWASTG